MESVLSLMIAEEKQLGILITIMQGLCHTKDFYCLSEREQHLLEEQLYPMNSYRSILKQRIAYAQGWVKPKVYPAEASGCENAKILR